MCCMIYYLRKLVSLKMKKKNDIVRITVEIVNNLNTFLKVIKSLEHPQAVYRFTNKGKYKSNNYIALTKITM